MGCLESRQAWDTVKKKAADAKEAASIPAMPCDAKVPNDPPQACLSGELQCGSVIEGTTEGGDDEWGDAFYARAFCYPAGDDRGGPERVYLFHAPENQDVTIRLDSDCVDLDVAAIAWSYDGSCPTENHNIPECTADGHAGGGKVRLNTFKARDYLVAVDGKEHAIGTFRLTVTCAPLVR
jgi:hypothetical protein